MPAIQFRPHAAQDVVQTIPMIKEYEYGACPYSTAQGSCFEKHEASTVVCDYNMHKKSGDEIVCENESVVNKIKRPIVNVHASVTKEERGIHVRYQFDGGEEKISIFSLLDPSNNLFPVCKQDLVATVIGLSRHIIGHEYGDEEEQQP